MVKTEILITFVLLILIICKNFNLFEKFLEELLKNKNENNEVQFKFLPAFKFLYIFYNT